MVFSNSLFLLKPCHHLLPLPSNWQHKRQGSWVEIGIEITKRNNLQGKPATIKKYQSVLPKRFLPLKGVSFSSEAESLLPHPGNDLFFIEKHDGPGHTPSTMSPSSCHKKLTLSWPKPELEGRVDALMTVHEEEHAKYENQWCKFHRETSPVLLNSDLKRFY